MTKADILAQPAGDRFTADGNAFIERLNRSDNLNQLALLTVHIAGCALMLAGPLLMAAAGGGSIYLYNNIEGPLDWFFAEVLTALTLFGAFLSWQLLRLQLQTEEGVTISESQAPEFHAMLDRRAGHFNAKPIKHVALVTQATLDISTAPTWPLPFWHRYTLRTGAPLLFFLSHRQFRLALAGTIAAFVSEKSALKRWLAHACSDWPVILQALENRPCLLSRLLLKPMRRINAMSNGLGQALHTDWREQQGQWVRANSDEQNLNDYLANQVIGETFMRKQYWPMILKAAERSPTPVVKAFSHLPILLDKTLNQALAERWLMQAQVARSKQRNSLRDLLATLQIEHLTWSGLPEQNAYSTLFNSNTVLKKLDVFWQNEIEPEWRERHQQFKADRDRFERLRQRAENQGLRGESALRFIKLGERFLDKKEAAPLYRQTVASNKDDAKVCFAGGLALLRSGAGTAGTSALQHAASLDRKLAKRVQALINEHKSAWLRETPGDADKEPEHQAIA